MSKPSFKLVGAPCGHHGQYTFYKAIRLSTASTEKIVAIGDFFYVRIWQDSELVSIGELQLLWTDRVSDQTLVSLRLYCLPENTPDGRHLHGEDEVLAINDKVVLRAEDLLSWFCTGHNWRWGLRAVWRGACTPPSDSRATAPLHCSRLDFSDVNKEKKTLADDNSPGVVVFSYPRYCRYRALLRRLEGIQARWLRDSLVAALGGYAAPTSNTRILYCKDTFEYPELEGHEFVCNHLAPRLKGRPRGRRRRRTRSASSRSVSDSDSGQSQVMAPRRTTLRNVRAVNTERVRTRSVAALDDPEEKEFLQQLKNFYRSRGETLKMSSYFKDLSLHELYRGVVSRGGFEAVCRDKGWRGVHNSVVGKSASPSRATRTRRHYERILLPYENHERDLKLNGPKTEVPIHTIDMTKDSPLREPDSPKAMQGSLSPKPEEDSKDLNITSKPASELNQEFLDSLPSTKAEEPVEVPPQNSPPRVLGVPEPAKPQGNNFFNELAFKLNLGNADTKLLADIARSQRELVSENHGQNEFRPMLNGGTLQLQDPKTANRPAVRSSLRSVRVKPTRTNTIANTSPMTLRPDSASSSPPVTSTQTVMPPITNFGINYPTNQVSSTNHHENISDDEIIEVPYKPTTPEIIDLDEYPESPQSVKKKKLDILKERGLEVTAIPNHWTQPSPVLPIPSPILGLNPAMQHQLMTQAQLYQIYNIVPSNYGNGVQPPKIIQGNSIFGSTGPEKTVYGNPKDPFMPPPHILHGAPIKPPRIQPIQPPPQDVLDLTCKSTQGPSQKPAVEIVRVPNVTSPAPRVTSSAQNYSKNYTLIDGKAVVGSNLEITLINPKSVTPSKLRPPQKRSSNGKFMSNKTPTPPKDYKPLSLQTPPKKSNIIIPSYQMPNVPEDVSPTSSTSSSSQNSNLYPYPKPPLELPPKAPMPVPMIDPMYMTIYNSLAGQLDQRQLAMYRDFMSGQYRGYTGLLNVGTVTHTPTTKN